MSQNNHTDYTDEKRIAIIRDKLENNLSIRKAAKKHDVSESSIERWGVKYGQIAKLKEGQLAEGHDIKGTSTLYDSEGNIKLTWIKTNKNLDDQLELLEKHVKWLCEDVKGLAPKVTKPKANNKDLLTVYPMGDPHFGLAAYAPESGEDFALEDAEERMCAAIDRLVLSTPASETALFLNLGDFFHADNNTNQTPASGAKLDVDGNFFRIAQVGLRAMIYCIERLREKHKKVIIWNIRGNHDPHQSLMLSLCLSSYYSNESNVEISLSPSYYQYFRFGKVLIGSTHGHGAKMPDLPQVMAFDRQEDWGETDYRYWYCGHIHHKHQKEYIGATVETFRTLAATDSWHALKGYRSNKDMQAIVHHKEFGEIERHTCSLKEILQKS